MADKKLNSGGTDPATKAQVQELWHDNGDGTFSRVGWVGATITATIGALQIPDGQDVAEGATTDAIVGAGAAGSLSAKLRRVTQALEDLKTALVLAAGSHIIGQVGIDQTTPGTTNAVVANAGTNLNTSLLAREAGGNLAALLAAAGAIGDAAWDYDDASASLVALLKSLSPNVGTAALSTVTGATSTGVLLAANNLRRAATVFNDSTANLYLAFAATATTSAFTIKIAAGAYYEVPQPCYRGAISGIWDAVNGAARLTEITQ